VSGQKLHNVSNVPLDATSGELIQGMLSQMNLPQNDVSGRPLTYHARLEREGRHLHASERVGDAVQTVTRSSCSLNIDAGR